MRELTQEQYSRRIDHLYEVVFKERMVHLLETWARVLVEEGYTVSGPHDLTDSEYRWYIWVDGRELPEAIDVSIEMSESLEYEGSTDGASFGLNIVAYGGRIIGVLTPYNYTPECWVPVNQPRALSDRLALIEGADIQDGVSLIDEYRRVAA